MLGLKLEWHFINGSKQLLGLLKIDEDSVSFPPLPRARYPKVSNKYIMNGSLLKSGEFVQSVPLNTIKIRHKI